MTLRNTTDELSPRIRDAIRERFDEISSLFGHPDGGGGATTSPQDQVDCLEKANALRISILDYVNYLHSDLRFWLSAAARINQLPDEILVHILSTLSFSQLVSATHVCHRWRKLGVGTPALWTRLTITDALVAGLDVVLARSKAASLDLELKVHRSPTNVPFWGPLLLAEPDLARVRSLTILSFRDPLNMGRSLHDALTSRRPVALRGGAARPLHWTPRLETLRLASRDMNFCVNRTLNLDCSTLREAYIIDGVSDIDFLRACNLLRVLVLHVPSWVRKIQDLLRVVRANPALRVLELHIPSDWKDAGRPRDDGHPHAPITCELERLVVRSDSTDAPDSTDASDSTDAFGEVGYVSLLAIISQFDHPRISDIEISCCFDGAGGDVLGRLLLADLHNVQSIVLWANSLRLQDARGYARSFVHVIASQELEMTLPFLGTVRSLGLHLSQWSALTAHGITELPSLKELTFASGIKDFRDMQCGVACPALRNLTVVESSGWLVQEPDESGDQPDFFTVAMDIPRGRIPSCPPLQLLTIVRECEHNGTRPDDQTLHLDPPAPRTVFVTSAVSEMPKLVAELDDGVPASDSAPLPTDLAPPPIWSPFDLLSP